MRKLVLSSSCKTLILTALSSTGPCSPSFTSYFWIYPLSLNLTLSNSLSLTVPAIIIPMKQPASATIPIIMDAVHSPAPPCLSSYKNHQKEKQHTGSNTAHFQQHLFLQRRTWNLPPTFRAKGCALFQCTPAFSTKHVGSPISYATGCTKQSILLQTQLISKESLLLEQLYSQLFLLEFILFSWLTFQQSPWSQLFDMICKPGNNPSVMWNQKICYGFPLLYFF